MNKLFRGKTEGRPPLPVPFYYGWVVVSLCFLASLNGAGNRGALSVLIQPLEQEFGWSRASIATAAALNLFLLGLSAPLCGWLLDRFGPKRIMLGAHLLIMIGVSTTTIVQEAWQLILVWGLIVGLGVGSLGNVLAASVAHRWFIVRRGLTLGILNSATSTGYLVFFPILMALVVHSGWRSSLLVLAVISSGLMLMVALWMRDDPSDVGLEPYGAEPRSPLEEKSSGTAATTNAPPVVPLSKAIKQSSFWFLCGSFFICGGTSAGLIGTHLIPHAIDRGIPEVTAAATVGVMGGMNFVGTVLSGYLTDKINPRKILAFVYTLRGVALFILPYVTDLHGLFIFAVVYGLDWFATVPPTVMLTGEAFGKQSIGSIYGWVFFSHQVGAAISATVAGSIFNWYGGYDPAFFSGGVMALVAGAVGLLVPRPTTTPLANRAKA
ncbi:MAG: MFS transporter [Deltaproteobacteria bacterium]|nr:MFS transporter [Deltaproteobacteria bacterium]